jgi:AcrR family transcriptional regulator
VLTTALKLADKKGLEALSMRSLAAALKVEAMSLYNHVESKEHLLDGLVDLVVAEIPLPARGGDWKAAMRKRAQDAHAVLLEHPWATQLFLSRINVGPHMLRYIDASLGCLLEAGFSYADADHCWSTLDAFVYGFTLQRLNFPIERGQYAAAARAFLPAIDRAALPSFYALSLEVAEERHDGIQHLELGLDMLLEGFDRLRRR